MQNNTNASTARLVPTNIPTGTIDYYTLDGHLLAIVTDTQGDDTEYKLFWGPDFNHPTIADWGNKGFDLSGETVDWNTDKHLFELTIQGYSRNGEKLNFTIWDSRYDAGYQRNIDRDEQGHLTLQCEEDTYAFQRTEAPSTSQWYLSSMNRRVTLLAKDMHFNYIYIDQLRHDDNSPDYRFFKGTKGNMRQIETVDLSMEYQKTHVLTTQGVFQMTGDDGTWVSNPTDTSTPIPVENMHIGLNARFIYTDLGAYSTKLLGTPCDIQWLEAK